jgi:hypothetical protein
MTPGTDYITRVLTCSVGSLRNRVQIRSPKQNLQVKLTRPLSCGGDFVAYVDANGEVDGRKCIIDWKTTTSRYPEQPDGLLTLDPQLVCYSWMAGISELALVVLVRKNTPEVQYLKTTIDEEQRREFGQLVETTVDQIEAGQSSLTAAFGFLRTDAQAALIWDFVSIAKNYFSEASPQARSEHP